MSLLSLNTRTLIIILALSIALMIAANGGFAMTLARGGKAGCCIVISKDAIESEKTAARELHDVLKKVTGADFAIRTESDVKSGAAQILVGLSKRLKQLAPDVKWAELGQDGIVIRTTGNKLLLAGGRPRGTLYAVYTFLEDGVGCRWWASDGSSIPHKPLLSIPQINRTYVPKLRYREAFYRDVNENSTLAARLKLNGHFYRIPANYGGHYSILGWCHTSYQLLGPDKYFAAHPEWYSEINGKRTTSGAQLCLTNEEMRRELTRVALEWIRKDPDAGIISISQNDCIGNCQCARCKAVEQEEGSPSGPLIRFVNAVAEDIEKEYPNMLVETLAYQYTRKPPLHVKPRQNVVVRLCSIECNFAKPLEDDANKTFRDDIRSWSAIAPNLYIWDYVTDFASYIQPQPNMRVLAPNVRFFEKNHAIGIFEQGDAACSIGDFVRLRAWVLAHLLWNPAQDEKKLTTEFLNGYYGAAGPYLQQYLDLVHDACESKGMHLSCYNGDLSFLTPEVMAKAASLFDQAAQAVAGDEILATRVRRERMPLDHVWLMRYDDLKAQFAEKNMPFVGPKDPAAASREFIKLARDWKAGNFSEGQSFESYAPSLESRFGPPPPTPEELSKLSEPDCVTADSTSFTLYGSPKLSQLVDDPKSPTGRAAFMPANHGEWAVQYSLPSGFPAAHPGKWRVYFVARCEGAKTGGAFHYGIYSRTGNHHVMTAGASMDRFTDGAYHTIYLGTHELADGMYVWIAPNGNPGTVKGIYIDRVVFVRETTP